MITPLAVQQPWQPRTTSKVKLLPLCVCVWVCHSHLIQCGKQSVCVYWNVDVSHTKERSETPTDISRTYAERKLQQQLAHSLVDHYHPCA